MKIPCSRPTFLVSTVRCCSLRFTFTGHSELFGSKYVGLFGRSPKKPANMEDSVRVTPPSFPLSLRPWPRERPEANSLPYLIGRIHEQRGHFRNITEKGLIELIQAEGNGEVEANEMDSEDEGGLERDIERRQKEVYEARGEMIRYIACEQKLESFPISRC